MIFSQVFNGCKAVGLSVLHQQRVQKGYDITSHGEDRVHSVMNNHWLISSRLCNLTCQLAYEHMKSKCATAKVMHASN